MWPAFIRGIEDNLPNAQITFDRFHIMKIIGTAIDTVHKQKVSLLVGTWIDTRIRQKMLKTTNFWLMRKTLKNIYR